MKICKILFLILIILSFNRNIYSDRRKVIIFSINCIDWEDLKSANLNTFNSLFKKASLGIMNVRSRRIDLGSCYLTIGTSSRGIGTSFAKFSFNYNENFIDGKSQEIFFRRTGKILNKENVFNPNIVKIKKENEIPEYKIKVGLLGDLLHKNNLKTAVFGNSDTDENHREIVCLCMDGDGIVDYGDVSKEILEKDFSYPYGIRTDYQKIFSKFKKLKNNVDLFVFEIGDTYRLDEYKEFLKEEIFTLKKKEIFSEIEYFLKNILRETNPSDTLLIILSAYPKKEYIDKNYFLTPVIFYGGEFKRGILKTDTTRQRGIVTNLDIIPTILSFLRIKENESFFGSKIKYEKEENNFEFIVKLEKRLFNISCQNIPFLKGIIIYQSISIVIALLFILLKLFKNFSIFLILSSALLPFSSLFLSIFPSESLCFSLIYLSIVVLFLIVFLKLIFKNNLTIFFSVCILTSCAILLDTIFGSYLMKYSPIGFSLSAGARYYGIGNEYLGILINSLILGICGIEEISKKNILNKIFFPVFILSILVVGYPKLGANVGGLITVIFAFSFCYFKIKDSSIDLKKFIYIILAIAFFLGIFIIIDISLQEEQSHMGKAVLQIRNEGIEVAGQIILRKLQMNFKLIQYTFWNKILITSLIVLSILYFYPAKFFKNMFSEFPYLSGGISGVIVGSIAGLIFNDSGIIITAVSFFGVAQTLLLLILEKKFK